MTIDDTVPVPRELIERAYQQSGGQISESLGRIYELAHPVKPAPRLRIVNLDAVPYEQARDDMWVRVDNLEALPDPMTVIEQASSDLENEGIACAATDELARRIRTALEGAAS